MTFDLEKVLESKRALRRRLAALPVLEKLRLLDAMRQRHLTLHGRIPRPTPGEEVRAPDPNGAERP